MKNNNTNNKVPCIKNVLHTKIIQTAPHTEIF